MHEPPSDQPTPTMPPILVADLFREISQHLITLLRSLTADEWHLPTSSSQRNIKDIASHLLDGSLRRLSMQRDGYFSPDDSSRMRSDETLLDFLNRLNSDWEKATRRLSPSVLLGLIEWADEQLADLFESLDPFAPAIFPVAWPTADCGYQSRQVGPLRAGLGRDQPPSAQRSSCTSRRRTSRRAVFP